MINAIAIEGRLGQGPDVRFTINGQKVANFSLAHTRRWKSGEEYKEETLWFKCEVWGWLAEKVEELGKGAPVLVVGELRLDEYTRKDGSKYSGFKVYVKEIRKIDYTRVEKVGQEAQPEPPKDDMPADDDVPF